MFSKPLSALTADDIDRLAKDQVRESDVVEFKEALSGKGGPDPWHRGAAGIGPAARDKVVNEIIAFANAHGGTLVLGIAESSDKPARAEKVAPVPRCADLAERLSRALADTVEPPLAPFPAVVPVPIDGDAGVVVFQVATSRNAPHRHRSTLQGHVRRGEQAVPMTMREIQDLTLQVERGLAGIERRFEQRAKMAAKWTPSKAAFTLRATAIPLSSVQVPGVPGDTSIYPGLHRVPGKFANGAQAVAQFPVHFSRWRPMLRGALTEERGEAKGYRVELQRDGLIEFVLAVENDERLRLYAAWFMGVACNSLIAIERTRQAAGTPAIEYGLDLAIVVPREPVVVEAFAGIHFQFGPIEPPGCALPRYSVGDRSTFEELLDLIQRDFWNAAGQNISDGELLKLDLQAFI